MLSLKKLIRVLAEAKRQHTQVMDEAILPEHEWEEWYSAFIWSRLEARVDTIHARSYANDFIYERAGVPKARRIVIGNPLRARSLATNRSGGGNRGGDTGSDEDVVGFGSGGERARPLLPADAKGIDSP